MNSGFIAKFSADVSAITASLKKIEQQTINIQVNTGNSNQGITQINKSLSDMNAKANIAQKGMRNVGNSARGMNTSIRAASKGIQSLGADFMSTFAKVAKFSAITSIIGLITRSFTEVINVVKDFDSAMTEMSKVSSYSGEQLRKYTQDLGTLGEEVGRTTTEITEMTTGWLKAGYSEDEASQLARYSALLQNTADEQLEASEATSILVSQLKAYHMEADEAIQVTDILNAVSAREAVSSGDLAKGLTQASASMATYGNSIEETTALLTAGTTVWTF